MGGIEQPRKCNNPQYTLKSVHGDRNKRTILIRSGSKKIDILYILFDLLNYTYFPK